MTGSPNNQRAEDAPAQASAQSSMQTSVQSSVPMPDQMSGQVSVQMSRQAAARDAIPTAAAPPAGATDLIVEHDTQYTYSTQVAFAQHLAHLTPLSGAGQMLQEFTLEIDPPPTLRHVGTDAFGNQRTYFSLNVAHEGLRVQTRSRVRVWPRYGGLDARLSPAWESVRDSLRYVARAPFIPATEFVFSSAFVPYDTALRDYAQASFGPRQSVLAGALDLMHRIHRDFRYAAGSTDVATPVRVAFAARAGVCQDFTHVMIGGLRALGLPACYVSGYLLTQAARPAADEAGSADPRPVRTLDGGIQPILSPEPAARAADTLVGADASHAWVSVYCPKFGWVELDPTNDMVPGTGHVRLAVGRDYGDVAPLRGVVQGGGEHQLRVAVRVTAVTPAVTA